MNDALPLYQTIGEALAIGLLIGSERYKARDGDERKSAGLRTFALISVLGATAALIAVPLYTVTIFASLFILLALGYMKESSESLGLTTEMAAVLTFWLGHLCSTRPALSIATAVAVVVLLASKRSLHRLVRGEVTDIEFYDTLKFLVVVFVVMPLLPSRDMGPYHFFNPAYAWGLVILVSSISYFGYLAIRLLGERRGLMLSSLVGGIVSTTAVTTSLAGRARTSPASSVELAVAAVLANAVQLPRLLILVAVVDLDTARTAAAPLMMMFALGLVGAWLITRLAQRAPSAQVAVSHTNPYSFWPALKFAGLFVGVLLATRAAQASFGASGVFLTSAVAGLLDVSAIALSATAQVGDGGLSAHAATLTILIGVASNAVMKVGLAASQGTRSFALWLAGGFAVMLGAGLIYATQFLM